MEEEGREREKEDEEKKKGEEGKRVLLKREEGCKGKECAEEEALREIEKKN